MGLSLLSSLFPSLLGFVAQGTPICCFPPLLLETFVQGSEGGRFRVLSSGTNSSLPTPPHLIQPTSGPLNLGSLQALMAAWLGLKLLGERPSLLAPIQMQSKPSRSHRSLLSGVPFICGLYLFQYAFMNTYCMPGSVLESKGGDG